MDEVKGADVCVKRETAEGSDGAGAVKREDDEVYPAHFVKCETYYDESDDRRVAGTSVKPPVVDECTAKPAEDDADVKEEDCDSDGEYIGDAANFCAVTHMPPEADVAAAEQHAARLSVFKHKCDMCDKRFTQRYSLNRHMLKHVGLKPFNCELCDKRFAQSGNLKLHMLVHTGEKPFKCELCGKRFSQSGHLKLHMLTHTGEKPRKCQLCEKKFSNSSHLHRHMLTHTGEMRHKCEVCERKFSQNSHLKQHMTTHTGEKPYKCDVCHRSFAQKYNLNQHMLRHTSDRLQWPIPEQK